MKKAKRILSILLALTMLLGTVSVIGSAYAPYRDNNIVYNDVDKPVFTTNQYASMALDEVDRMLAEEQIKLDVYVLTVDLTSIDAALDCIANVFTTLGSLKGLLGDVANLNLNALKVGGQEDGAALARSTTEDIDILYALLQFLADNSETILAKYVNGGISLGILQGVVSDYLFNVRELAMGFLYSLIAPKMANGEKYDYFDDGADYIPAKYNASGASTTITNGFDLLLQDLLNYFVLGDWVLLDDYFSEEGVAVLDDEGNPALDGNNEPIYIKREFSDYDFGAGNETMDVTNKNYYGWLHRDNWVTYALGGAIATSSSAPAPAPSYSTVDFSAAVTGYDFIENLMQVAYNKLAVPELNSVTKHWLRQTCGIVYLDQYTNPESPDYDPNYAGEPYEADDLQPFAGIFALDTMNVPIANVDNGETFVDCFNDILGDFLEHVLVTNDPLTNERLWTWTYSTYKGDSIPSNNEGNNYLFDNIVDVAKYVLKETGGAFFADYVDVLEPSEIDGLDGQGVVAYVLRSILNASIGWLFIPDDANNDTIAEVCFTICEQLAYQDIPQFTYTRPVKTTGQTDAEYNTNLVNACLDILLDVAVYNLNQGLDMNSATGTNPNVAANNGLLQYLHDYEPLVVQIVAWALKNYGSALAFNDDFTTTESSSINNVWADIDTIVNNIFPIKGDTAWINSSISTQTYVVKSLLFDNIIGAVTNLNPVPFDAIFTKNPNGGFGTANVKSLAITLVTNIVNNLLLPGVLGNYTSFDGVLQNGVLAGIVTRLITGLNSRRADLLAVILPIVCDALGLSAEQEFEEIEIYLPSLIKTTGYVFAIYNGSSGLNTAFKGGTAARTQDHLYVYDISSVVINVNNATTGAAVTGHGINVTGITGDTTIAGGQRVQATIGGQLANNVGNIVEVQINYTVLGEDGTPLTSSTLSSSAFAYISATDGGDDVVKVTENFNGNEIKYATDIYLGRGDSLTGLETYAIEVKTPSATSLSLSSTTVSGGTPFITTAAFTPYTATTADGTYYPTPMKIAAYNDNNDLYTRSHALYTENTENLPDFESEFTGNYSAEVGEIANGVYTVTTNLNIGGANKAITTRVHLYDDFDIGDVFNNAVGTNRQKTDYDMEANSGAGDALFTAYKTAVRNVANAALANKSGGNFETYIKNGTGINSGAGITTTNPYVNIYHKYIEELDASIEALEDYKVSAGYTSLRNAISDVSPYNYSYTADGTTGGFIKTIRDAETNRTELEYYETGYSFFGMRDFVPHTYSRYKEERNAAQNLINQQMIFKPIAPINPGENATQAEAAAYNRALEQYDRDIVNYNKALTEIPALSAIDVTYAQHMVDLTASRLLYAKADISKLTAVYDLYNYTNGTAAGLLCTPGNANGWYLTSRWNDYKNACDFALATINIGVNTLDNDGNPALRPSRVNAAISNLVESWKKLARGADKTSLTEAIDSANTIISAATFETGYTPESRAALIEERNKAIALVDAELAATEANSRSIQFQVTALIAATGALEPVASDPVYEFPTINPGVFYDSGWMNSYTPVVNQGMNDNMAVYMANPTKFVTGVGEYMDEGTISANLFGTLENATLDITPSRLGAYGTGTTVNVLDAQNVIVDSYTLIISGDVNGDGVADASDAGMVELRTASVYYWYIGAEDEYYYNQELGGDVAGGDYMCDATDLGEFEVVSAGLAYFNQDTGTKAYY